MELKLNQTMIKTKEIDKLLGKMVEITWLDVISNHRIDKTYIAAHSIKNRLAVCVSYGKIYRMDNDGLILASELNEDEIDETLLVWGLITDIKELVYNNQKEVK